MPLKSKEVKTAICKKGFQEENSDHKRYVFWHNGTKTKLRTMMSHNEQEIGANLQTAMAQQLRLSKKEFLLFVSCKMSEAEYKAIMSSRGHLTGGQ